MSPKPTPEQRAREGIDRQLQAAGWVLQDRAEMNLHAAPGVAVREFPLKVTQGFADYLLFVDQRPVGVVEAKPEGHTLSGVEPQARDYAGGLPATLAPPVRPLPFLYLSTGVETRFTNGLDPEPKSRALFSFHRPDTLAEWIAAKSLAAWTDRPVTDAMVAESGIPYAAWSSRPSSLRSRLRSMPPLPSRATMRL